MGQVSDRGRLSNEDRATIRFIESTLEEEERNTLFQIRLLKDRPVSSD